MSALSKKMKLLATEEKSAGGVTQEHKDAYAFHKKQIAHHKKYLKSAPKNSAVLHEDYMKLHAKKADAIRAKYKPSVWAASHGK